MIVLKCRPVTNMLRTQYARLVIADSFAIMFVTQFINYPVSSAFFAPSSTSVACGASSVS